MLITKLNTGIIRKLMKSYIDIISLMIKILIKKKYMYIFIFVQLVNFTLVFLFNNIN